jgi:hypothetical protein
MTIKRLPAGFIIPAQPVLASKPPFGADWVHEIKHDGPCPVWIKVRNPASIAVRRERSEMWNR